MKDTYHLPPDAYARLRMLSNLGAARNAEESQSDGGSTPTPTTSGASATHAASPDPRAEQRLG